MFKKFNNFIFIFLLILIIKFTVYSQSLLVNEELIIENYAGRNITVKVYPVGCIFNGDKDYSFRSKLEIPEFPFITGSEFYNLQNGLSFRFEHDADGGNFDISVNFHGIIGYGKYRIDFYEWFAIPPNLPKWHYQNYCYVDFTHSNYPWVDPPNGLTRDIPVYYYGDGIIKGWEQQTLPEDRTLKIWDQRSPNAPNAYEPQNKNGFKTTNANNGEWLNFSLVATDYQNPFPIGHETSCKCFVNIAISSNNIGKVVCGNSFELTPGNIFQLKSSTNFGTKLYVGSTDNNNICNAMFIVEPTTNALRSYILFESQTEFIVRNGSTLYLNNNSNVNFSSTTSKMIINSGGRLCMNGEVRFNGPGYLIINGLISKNCTDPGISTPLFKDSVKLVIDANSVLELPDSTFIRFNGSETKLICKENSEIKFGKGSKLIFEDGARLIANGCRFTSYDSTDTWDGIYLSGIAYDTIKNCTFQNTVNGINITDNYDPFGSPGAVEISNCTFKNSTSTELLNYVYINNSYNVLVKGNNAVKTGSAGFTAGIIAEYCPAGGVVICDNNINYVNTGISLLQSSEYIARNVITGYSNTGTGIYLDNSNGTIEYNTVNNFQKSIYGSYSSPYLLKNTLIDAYITNIDLVNSSMPVMKPVISSSALRWLGGNNTITRATPPPSIYQRHKIC